MLMALDVGNSNITIGVFDGDNQVCQARLATAERRTADQYALEIKNILSLKGCDTSNISGAIIGSVVPVIGNALKNAVITLLGIEPLMLGPGIKTGLNICLDDPAELGADLVAGAVGALSICKAPCIIIDMGTATTISVLKKDGSFAGGIIAAGVELTRDILTQKTAQLPSIKISAPDSVIGHSTDACMRSGLIYGTAAMLDGLIERIEAELGYECSVIATGGLSAMVVPYCHRKITLADSMVLDGLRIIYNKNR